MYQTLRVQCILVQFRVVLVCIRRSEFSPLDLFQDGLYMTLRVQSTLLQFKMALLDAESSVQLTSVQDGMYQTLEKAHMVLQLSLSKDLFPALVEINGHRHSDEHWNCITDHVGEPSERCGEAHMDFSERINTILNSTGWHQSPIDSFSLFYTCAVQVIVFIPVLYK